MKRVISIVLAVILCVLTLGGCEKVQGDGVSTEVESGASESGVDSAYDYDTDRIKELILMAFSVNCRQFDSDTDFCFNSLDDIKSEGLLNCFYSFENAENFYDVSTEKYVFTADDVQDFLDKNFYNANFHPDEIDSTYDIYMPENDGYTYIKSGFCGFDGIKQSTIINDIVENGEMTEVFFALGELENPDSTTDSTYVLTMLKADGNYLIYRLAVDD